MVRDNRKITLQEKQPSVDIVLSSAGGIWYGSGFITNVGALLMSSPKCPCDSGLIVDKQWPWSLEIKKKKINKSNIEISQRNIDDEPVQFVDTR